MSYETSTTITYREVLAKRRRLEAEAPVQEPVLFRFSRKVEVWALLAVAELFALSMAAGLIHL